MTATALSGPALRSSPRFIARAAGVSYVVNILTGSLALFFAMRHDASGAELANLVATMSYIVVTLLFYHLFKPVDRNVALAASFFSILGCAPLRILNVPVNSLGFFGLYCVLIGFLIVRSTFLPRILGAFLAVGGIGWLTFFVPALARRLMPYNMVPGIFAETALTIWLLAAGVNERRWYEQESGVTR